MSKERRSKIRNARVSDEVLFCIDEEKKRVYCIYTPAQPYSIFINDDGTIGGERKIVASSSPIGGDIWDPAIGGAIAYLKTQLYAGELDTVVGWRGFAKLLRGEDYEKDHNKELSGIPTEGGGGILDIDREELEKNIDQSIGDIERDGRVERDEQDGEQ